MTTVMAMYDNPNQGRQACDAIAQAGFGKDRLKMIGGNGGNQGAISSELGQCGFEREEAALYAKAIDQGHVVVLLDAPDEKVETALSILRSKGSRNPEEILSRYRQHGGQQQSEKVPVVEEEVTVGKQQVQQGGVRVTSNVSERPIEKSVHLHSEKVNVDRKPTDRELSPEEASKAFQQKSVEMKETTEQPSIHKQAKVVEEVNVGKTAQEREEKIQTSARRSDVKVEPIPPHQQGQQGGSSGGGKQG